MMRRRQHNPDWLVTLWFAIAVSACGQPVPSDSRSVPTFAVKSRDFAFVPCGPVEDSRPCALLVAGGKRVLFGAPAGVAATIARDDLRQIDALMLFSLRAGDIEGVDEIRNAGWHAGRRWSLPVVGPRGTERVITALNQAFEQADALYVVDRDPSFSLDYNAAVLLGREADTGETVFDTGDLSVRFLAPSVFLVQYTDAMPVILSGCRRDNSDVDDQDWQVRYRAVARIGCDDDGRTRWQWPLSETVFIVRH